MKLRERWNTFKTNVKELKKEDLGKFLPKVDFKVNIDNLKGNVLLLFQEKLDNNVILFTLEHMVMTGQIDAITFMRYAADKKLDAETYAKIRNYRKHGYHLVNPTVVPINTLVEPSKLKFMITDKSEFEHRESSKRASILQQYIASNPRSFSIEGKIRSINIKIDEFINDRKGFYAERPDYLERDMANVLKDIELVVQLCEINGFYLECRGNELFLHKPNTLRV